MSIDSAEYRRLEKIFFDTYIESSCLIEAVVDTNEYMEISRTCTGGLPLDDKMNKKQAYQDNTDRIKEE